MKGLQLLIVLQITSAQFIEQPDSETIFAPVQEQVSLTCSVEIGYFIDWHVVFVSGDEAYASNQIAHDALIQQNFTLEGVITSRSTLSLWETETQTNNGTNITCMAYNGDIQILHTGNTVQVIFFGAPPPPTNPIVTENKLGSFNISWSLGFIKEVPVNYTLTVLNLNTTSAQPIIIAGLLDQHYLFETSRPCDVYSFTVTAVTAAGNSTPSQERNDFCSTNPITGPEVYIGATAGAVITTVLIIFILIMLCKNSKQAKSRSLVCWDFINDVKQRLHKTKDKVTTEDTAPVYEIVKDVEQFSLPTNASFAMTVSSAYGVSTDLQRHKHIGVENSPSSVSSANSSATETNIPFVMTQSSAYGIVM